MGHLCPTSLQGLGNVAEEYEREEDCDTSSGLYVDVAHMSSQQLWLSTQNLHSLGIRKMAQDLRAYIALPGDPSLILSTHIRWLATVCNSNSPLATACM